MWHQEGEVLHSLDSSPSKDSTSVSAACSPPPASQGASMTIGTVPEERSPDSASDSLRASNWPVPSQETPIGSARRSVSKRNPLAEAEVASDAAHPNWNVVSGPRAVEIAVEQVSKKVACEQQIQMDLRL